MKKNPVCEIKVVGGPILLVGRRKCWLAVDELIMLVVGGISIELRFLNFIFLPGLTSCLTSSSVPSNTLFLFTPVSVGSG
jgi:hypothetical protein